MHFKTISLALAASVLAACGVGDNEVVDPGGGALDAGASTDRAVPSRDSPAPFDSGSRIDASGPTDAGSAPTEGLGVRDARAGCGARELCDNRVDDDCNGMVDEGCACIPMTTQMCSTLDVGLVGRGACASGTQRCVGMGEFGAWGPCEGEVGPTPETCNGRDDDCDGMVDEGLSQACYPGPMGTAGVGPCRAGSQQCVMGAWGACVGAVVPVAEVCTNRIDDDCNGTTDECTPCIMAMGMTSPWQSHRVMGPVCFGRTFTVHGDPGEFSLSRIPAESDPGWRPVASASIDFSERSALCGRSCECLTGGEFTYFQTAFDLPAGYVVRSLTFSASGVDDGAQVTVFNSRYPAGIVDSGSYIRLGAGGATADLARYFVAGRNRVVITHIDDCCSDRSLVGVRIVLNGGALVMCPMP